MGNRHSKESNIGSTIYYDSIVGQCVYDGKDIVQLAFNMGLPSFNQGLGLEFTGASHNEFAVDAV